MRESLAVGVMTECTDNFATRRLSSTVDSDAIPAALGNTAVIHLPCIVPRLGSNCSGSPHNLV